jgi:TldD protein
MGCTFIDAGTDDPAEIVRSTSHGLFIRRLATGHTDPVTGRATFVVTDADRIEAGRLCEPLETFILVLEGRDAWSSIDRVGHDLRLDACVGSCLRDGQPLAVSVGAPTIRIGVVGIRF